jgi:hypothetical protein
VIVAEKLPGGPEHAAQITDGVVRASAWEQSSPVLESSRAAARALKDAVLEPYLGSADRPFPFLERGILNWRSKSKPEVQAFAAKRLISLDGHRRG